MREAINIYSLPFLILAALYCALPLSIFWHNKRSPLNISFIILGISVAVWQLPLYIVYNLIDTSSAHYWFRVSYSGFLFIAPACYQFVVRLLKLNRRVNIIIFYACAVFLSLAAYLSDRIILTVIQSVESIAFVPGDAYFTGLLLWIVPFALAIAHLAGELRRTDSLFNRKRIHFLLFIIPVMTLSLASMIPDADINIFPFGLAPAFVYILAMNYAIVRYRVINIEILLKKASIIFIGTLFAAILIYVSIPAVNHYFYDATGMYWIVLPICISFLIGAAYLRFLDFVRSIGENELSKKFTYRAILKKETERICTAKNIDELAQCMVRNLSNWVELDYVSVFIFNSHSKSFTLAKSILHTPSGEQTRVPAELTLDNPLVQMLINKKNPVVRSELQYYLDNRIRNLYDAQVVGSLLEMAFLGSEVTIPSFYEGRLLAFVNIGHRLNRKEIITTEDLEFFAYLSSSVARTLQALMQQKEKAKLMVASSNAMIASSESKGSYMKGHTERVAHFAALLGKELQSNAQEAICDAQQLYWSAQLHDAGKTSIPENILYKSGPLNEREWLIMKEHPSNGLKIIAPVKEWLGDDVCAGVSQHHENFDGSGYPFGIKGEEINLYARIIRVADAFDAMTSSRPYRSLLQKKEAAKEIDRCSGISFDPRVAGALKNLYLKGALGF